VSILGNRVLRREDPKFLTTGGIYGDDLDLEGALWVTFVRSTVAHARIAALDVSEAVSMPGVVAIYTGSDVDIELEPGGPGLNPGMLRPILAKGTVRFVGEPVAAILTETRYAGEDAAEQVFVDYDPLPVLIDPEESLAASGEGGTLLYPKLGTNVAVVYGGDAVGGVSEGGEPESDGESEGGQAGAAVPWGFADYELDEHFFDDCEVVVHQRVLNSRVAPCPLEVRSGAAEWGANGRLTQWASNQAPHGAKATICAVYNLVPELVRVIAPDVGGGFGAKIGLYAEDLILPWLARAAGRPVRWTETRSESMLALGHGRGQVQDVTIGGSRDGRVLAYRLVVVQDAGAYPAIGAFLPSLTRVMASGTYDFPKVEFLATSVVTNTNPIVAYRGAGRPEATAVVERAMDLFAAELGLSAVDVRRKNLVGSDRFPFTTPTGTVYDVGDYERALDLVLAAAGYEELRAEQARRRASGAVKQLGIGVSSYVEITNGGGPGEFAAVEVLPSGKAKVYTGTSPHGQGHLTAWSMLASEQLGIPMEDIEVIASDTDKVAQGGGTFGSRSLQAGGVAVHEASIELVDQARQLAAESLEASVDDVVLDRIDGRFHVAGTPALGRTWAEIATLAGEVRAGSGLREDGGPRRAEAPGLRVEHNSNPGSATFPFGAHVAVVEVDTETGAVRLDRLVAVDDAGTIINPLLAEGQRHGGLAQGAAQALMEEFIYDAEGNPVTSTLADYPMISATELPSFELVSMETPTPINALGAKGIGESGTIGSAPAVQSAVVDAVAHLGIRHIDMPTTPQRVWEAISASAASKEHL
jgi:aerobic carbon-monoxide dehydrogenase large subunit